MKQPIISEDKMLPIPGSPLASLTFKRQGPPRSESDFSGRVWKTDCQRRYFGLIVLPGESIVVGILGHGVASGYRSSVGIEGTFSIWFKLVQTRFEALEAWCFGPRDSR